VGFEGRELVHPLAFAAGCLVWLPVGVWVVALLQWTIQGDIDFISGLIGTLIGITLGLFTMMPPDPTLAPLFFSVAVATVMLFPVLQRGYNRRALHQIDIDQLARAYELVGGNAGNVGARLKIAQIVYHKGLVGHAVGIGDKCLEGVPKKVFWNEIRMVNGWRYSMTANEERRAIACPDCGYSNLPGDVYCGRCNGPYLLRHLRSGSIGNAGFRRLVAGWLITVLFIAGVPAAARLLPPNLALLTVAGFMVVAILILFAAASASLRRGSS
jgi:hypothetical protein